MPRPTKRQQQVSKLSRKRGRFVPQKHLSREAAIISEVTVIPQEQELAATPEVAAHTSEEALAVDVLEWEEEELREFEVVGKRFINEALLWRKEAASGLRTVYTGTLRSTKWRQKKGKI